VLSITTRGAEYIGLHGFHWIKLAGRHLLERSGVEHEVHPLHGLVNAIVIAYIPDIKLQLRVVHGDAHLFLLFLVPAEDADLANVGRQKAAQYSIAERACAAGDHQDFVVKHEFYPIGMRA
jgi:hypothetical protein